MRFTGFEFSNFRSIGGEPVILSPLHRCNIIIGQNNAGKSNIIRAIQTASWAVHSIAHGSVTSNDPNNQAFSAYDAHKRDMSQPFRFKLSFEAEDEDDSKLMGLVGTEEVSYEFTWSVDAQLPEITDSPFTRFVEFSQGNSILYALNQSRFPNPVPVETVKQAILPHSRQIFVQRFASLVPIVKVVPEFRQIRPGDMYSFSGSSLVELLATYQHPEFGRDADRERFDSVQTFVRRLLHLPDATLEVTHKGSELMLMEGGLRLPLSSYGTGVHQLVIMLVAVLSLNGAICCIEEPEIHLHPTLQREFIEFILAETSNTYVLSTHSPILINIRANTPNATHEDLQVFHLRREAGTAVGGPVLRDEHSLAALQDLGVRASDLLQANSIIWVEGPSDRIYLNHWIKLVDPSLVEGLHYTIMYYGGRLLAHLTVDREQTVEELIDLLKINQNAIVVIDSDRRTKHDRVNTTKRRICAECEASGGLCWITDGREVENYLPSKVVERACCAKGVRVTFEEAPFEKFDEQLDGVLTQASARAWRYADNKVKYARLFVRHFEAEDMSQLLRRRVAAVIDKVSSWNT